MNAYGERLTTRQIFMKALKKTWEKFAQRTMIHGVRYINDRNGNKYTKLLWIGLCVTAIITSFYLLGTFFLQFKGNPTRVNVQSSHVPISELNFPSVTFCNIKRIHSARASQLIDSLFVVFSFVILVVICSGFWHLIFRTLPPNVTREQLRQAIEFTAGFSIKMDQKADPDELELLQSVLNDNRYTVENTMTSLAHPCDEFIFRCRFEGVMRDCRTLFRRVNTFRGYCCSFNSRRITDKSFNYTRTNYFGSDYGLTVALVPPVDYTDTSYGDGVRMLIHDGRDFPSDTAIEKLLPIGFETFTRVTGEETTCSGDVMGLSWEDRNCVFSNERELRSFDDYRENNCDIECRMLKIVSRCDCVPFLYPNADGGQVCNFTKIPCLIENFDFIYETNANISVGKISCACPSNCNNFYYDVRTNTVPMLTTTFRLDTFYNGINGSHVVVHIFMGSQVFRRLRRDLLSHYVILIANFGGVFSLFLGLSVVSFFEIAIFFTAHLYRQYKEELKNAGKVDSFSKRAENHDVRVIQEKVMEELQKTLEKY